MVLQEIIQAEAERLGFLLSGVTLPTRPPHFDAYTRWLAQGRHASMAYLAAERAVERRENPSLILPEARSLLVVALRCFAPSAAEDGPHGEALGRVASYAWGADYHDVIPPLLEALVQAVERRLGRPLARRAYTDTGPILERDFAQRAGIGWAGKNTCIISPRHGSYFLLGETFLDAEIEPSAPLAADHCGTCTRCIEACPTACILPDRTLDAGRCISYLTIENKGPIPAGLRPSLGDWVFGCDICQQVCPWNLRFATPQGHPALAPHPGLSRPALRRELRLTAVEFNRKFRRSPIQRARRRGYLRSVAVALGNSGDTTAIPDLAQTLLEEPEPLVRAHAAWALGRMRARAARAALEKARPSEPDSRVSEEISAALQA